MIENILIAAMVFFLLGCASQIKNTVPVKTEVSSGKTITKQAVGINISGSGWTLIAAGGIVVLALSFGGIRHVRRRMAKRMRTDTGGKPGSDRGRL